MKPDRQTPMIYWQGADHYKLAELYLKHCVSTIGQKPEAEERLFTELDDSLKADGVRHLVVFDELDRFGDGCNDPVKTCTC